MSATEAFYNRFFARGGWKYDLPKEKRFLREQVIRAGGWKRGQHVLEVGAGMGQHSELIRQLGFDATALEFSASGAAYARKHFPKVTVVHADAASWSPDRPLDHVFARGMSFFHYELLGRNCRGIDVPRETARMFAWIKSGGTFVLQIITDFSGKVLSNGVHMNRLGDYLRLFSALGDIISVEDWNGKNLKNGVRGRIKTGILIATQKR